MTGLSILDPRTWDTELVKEQPAYAAGNALGWLYRGNKQAATSYPLSGRLYLSKSGWLLLSVPNALVRGVFDALSAPGTELPLAGVMNVPDVQPELLNAHISVMTADEVAKIGAHKINERGHMYGYTLAGLHELDVKNVDGVSKVWALKVLSPGLAALRKSYGLPPKLHDQHDFHITIAVRRKRVLDNNSVSKFDTPVERGQRKEAAQERVRVVLPYKDKYLLETLNNPKWPENLGKRRFIGGGIEEGETPIQAATREMFEELGVKIKPKAFRHLGNDPDKPHEHYLELAKHKIEPGNFNATVGSDAVISLAEGLPSGDDYMGPDLQKLLALPLKRAGDLLSGGEADHKPDNAFPAKKLNEGAKHEREHTDNPQIAREIAKDHLQEEPDYYKEHQEKVTKRAESTYWNLLKNQMMFREPIAYDPQKPVFENVKNQMLKLKHRGDMALQARYNDNIWRTQLDPEYRYQMAMRAVRGQPLPGYPGVTDRLIYTYGTDALNRIPFMKVVDHGKPLG